VQTALDDKPADASLEVPPPSLAEPRALRYRRSTKTLLVIGEGAQTLAELDAGAVDPAAIALATFPIGAQSDPTEPAFDRCAGPTGLALAADEETAFVWCPGSGDLEAIDLGAFAATKQGGKIARLAPDPLPKLAARGRRVFHDATDTVTSGGVACAG